MATPKRHVISLIDSDSDSEDNGQHSYRKPPPTSSNFTSSHRSSGGSSRVQPVPGLLSFDASRFDDLPRPDPKYVLDLESSSSDYYGVPCSQDGSFASPDDEDDRDAWRSAEVTAISSQEKDNDYGLLLGSWNTNVVGIRYYDGVVTPGEMVRLFREPSNRYDSNAIRVDNVMGQQIGHIPRGVASKLAPFVDDRRIIIEARLTGPKTQFNAPVRLNLYGTSDQMVAASLTDELRNAGVPKNALGLAERERKKQEKENKTKALKDAAAQAKRLGQKGTQQSRENAGFANLRQPGTAADPENVPDMDDILDSSVRFDPREIGSVVDKYGTDEDALSQLPMAKQPAKLATQLLPYQLQGLAWMIEHENPKLPSKGSEDTTQLWKPQGNGRYINLATNYTMAKPTLASGGILADDMGLGKTIQVIAMLVADPQPRPQPTLIVSPLSVMSNWAQQAEMHVAADKQLKILTYHGSNRKSQKPKDFEEYDVVITTYQTLALEYMPPNQHSAPAVVPRKNGLFSVRWRRVVLDEGHNIRSPKTKMAQAAYALLAQSRWVLTGTPIVNNLKDLYSHVKFLRLTGGLEQQDVFNAALVRPVTQGRSDGNMLLQALMSTLCLRRMKDMKFVNLKLPELTSHRYSVKFRAHEREKYEAFSAEAKGVLRDMQTATNRKGESTYANLLEVLLRMRQTCNHWKLCGERTQNLLKLLDAHGGKLPRTPDNLRALQDLLKLNIDQQEDCPVCLEPLHEPKMTRCAHAFGFACIERVIAAQHRCPMCRQELGSVDELVDPRAEGEDDDDAAAADARDDADDPDASSSKVDALLDILRASRNKSAATKTVVFSQWTSFLGMLEPRLAAAGFGFCRLDGTMSAARRDAAMAALARDADCTVMLASLGVCSVGLNLVAANQVVLADSWWAPAVEDQAVDRVHRLGQTRPTTVFRLVMEDSIEDRVLELQARKRKLMMDAFGDKKDRRKEKGARFADIESLLK